MLLPDAPTHPSLLSTSVPSPPGYPPDSFVILPHPSTARVTDRSGNVTYDELYRVCRAPLLHRGLGIRKKEVSDAALRALWCALDDNDSSTVKHDEFIRFLRLAPDAEDDHVGYKHSKDYDAHEASMAIRREAEAIDTQRVDYARTTKEVRTGRARGGRAAARACPMPPPRSPLSLRVLSGSKPLALAPPLLRAAAEAERRLSVGWGRP